MRIEDHTSFISTVLELEVVTPVRAGVFGRVYLAKQGSRRVAVKMPHVAKVDCPKIRRLQIYEDNMAHIRQEHEAYVRAHNIPFVPNNSELKRYLPNFFSSGPGRAYATEYTLHGGITLLVRDYIVGEEMKKEEIIGEISHRRRLLRAVKSCHKAGIVGLDIRRPNTIIGPRGAPHLIDFGHSLFEENLLPAQAREYEDEDFRRLHELFVQAPKREAIAGQRR